MWYNIIGDTMNLRYKTETNINKKSILSATKPEAKLSLTEETKSLNTRLKTKKILKVFIEPETNKKFVEAAAAYVIGYIDVTKFNMDDNLYGPLKEEELKDIKYNFEIEFQNINIKNENSKSNKK